jgi:hypothetical protein
MLVTLDLSKKSKNAEFPMLVTGRPLIVLGMTTAPPEPVYFVIAIAPPLTRYWNWAFAAAVNIIAHSRQAIFNEYDVFNCGNLSGKSAHNTS